MDAKTLEFLAENPEFDKPVAILVELLATEDVMSCYGETGVVIRHEPGRLTLIRIIKDRTKML